MVRHILLGSVTFVLLSSASTMSFAEDINKQQDVRKLYQTLETQKKELKTQNTKLQRQERQLQQLQQRLNVYFSSDKSLDDSSLSDLRGAGRRHRADTESQEVGITRKPKDKNRPPEIPALADEGGVLTHKGNLVIEPSVEYTRSSALRVAIEGFTVIPALNVGSFTISQVDRDTVSTALTARYGITNRIEIEGRVPYVYRSDTTLSRPVGTGSTTETQTEATGNNLGDIEVAGHYQINKGKNGLPFFVGNLRFKTRTGEDPFEVEVDPTTGLQTELPTGSGFYSLQPSITAIFPSDPVVFYTNLGYTVNFERDLGGSVGTISPGDNISASFGMGFSVNERSSFSVGYSHDTVFKTEQNGNTIPNSQVLQVGVLNIGYAYSVNPHVGVNFNIGAGLTDDAPDARLTLRVPIAFNLLK